MIRKKTLLVTGGAGFIGSNLVKFILKKNLARKIIVLDNYSSGSKINHITNSKISYFRGNTKNILTYKKIIKHKIDLIFHLAEFSRIVQSFKYLLSSC